MSHPLTICVLAVLAAAPEAQQLTPSAPSPRPAPDLASPHPHQPSPADVVNLAANLGPPVPNDTVVYDVPPDSYFLLTDWTATDTGGGDLELWERDSGAIEVLKAGAVALSGATGGVDRPGPRTPLVFQPSSSVILKATGFDPTDTAKYMMSGYLVSFQLTAQQLPQSPQGLRAPVPVPPHAHPHQPSPADIVNLAGDIGAQEATVYVVPHDRFLLITDWRFLSLGHSLWERDSASVETIKVLDGFPLTAIGGFGSGPRTPLVFQPGSSLVVRTGGQGSYTLMGYLVAAP